MVDSVSRDEVVIGYSMDLPSAARCAARASPTFSRHFPPCTIHKSAQWLEHPHLEPNLLVLFATGLRDVLISPDVGT